MHRTAFEHVSVDLELGERPDADGAKLSGLPSRCSMTLAASPAPGVSCSSLRSFCVVCCPDTSCNM